MRLLFVIPLRSVHPVDALLHEEWADDASSVSATALQRLFAASLRTNSEDIALQPRRVGRKRQGARVSALRHRDLLSTITHAERVVVCAHALDPTELADLLSRLSTVNRHADCVIHPFFGPTTNMSEEVTQTCDPVRDLLALRPPNANPLLRHGSLSAAAFAMRDTRLIQHRLFEDIGDILRIPRTANFRGDICITIVMVQTLFWLRRGGGSESARLGATGEPPLKTVLGPWAWKDFFRDSRALSFIERTGHWDDELSFVLADRGYACLDCVDPVLEDRHFADRLVAWADVGYEAAEPEIDAYVRKFRSVQTAWIKHGGAS